MNYDDTFVGDCCPDCGVHSTEDCHGWCVNRQPPRDAGREAIWGARAQREVREARQTDVWGTPDMRPGHRRPLCRAACAHIIRDLEPAKRRPADPPILDSVED